jgi:ATP-dependent DNA helicase RecQ
MKELLSDQDVATQLPDVVTRDTSVASPSFIKRMGKMKGALKKMGFASLRAGQDRAVMNLLNGKDTFCVLPTGGGKSAIYIVPCLCADWCCLIFSPLISLMQDQMQSLQQLGLSAAQISSAQTPTENMSAIKLWEMGELQFLFVAPERLENTEFLKVMQLRKPNMVTIDEAHCVSQWSDSFRPSYVKVGNLVSLVNPDVVLAITATATKEIEDDARTVLGIPGAARVVYLPPRDNLQLTSQDYSDDRVLLEYIESHTGPTIVYCATRKRCEELLAKFAHQITGGCLVYHGGMPTDARQSNQHRFMSDETRVMFATNAFGLGINKPNIRMIIHRDAPKSIEEYSQEAGRSGRDGLPSQCVLLMDDDAFRTNRYFIDNTYPPKEVIQRVYHLLKSRMDANKQVMLTGENMAQALGLQGAPVNAALGILKSSGVVDREDDEVRPVTISIMKEHPESKFASLLADVRKFGRLMPNERYEVNMEFLAAQTARKVTTMQTHLKKLDQEGYILYTAPFRGKTTTLKGDLTMVDFERLQQRKEASYEKLEAIYRFHDTPDEDKHQFLTTYFQQ